MASPPKPASPICKREPFSFRLTAKPPAASRIRHPHAPPTSAWADPASTPPPTHPTARSATGSAPAPHPRSNTEPSAAPGSDASPAPSPWHSAPEPTHKPGSDTTHTHSRRSAANPSACTSNKRSSPSAGSYSRQPPRHAQPPPGTADTETASQPRSRPHSPHATSQHKPTPADSQPSAHTETSAYPAAVHSRSIRQPRRTLQKFCRPDYVTTPNHPHRKAMQSRVEPVSTGQHQGKPQKKAVPPKFPQWFPPLYISITLVNSNRRRRERGER